jgi:predicted DNA-binding protein (UPF0251 family)
MSELTPLTANGECVNFSGKSRTGHNGSYGCAYDPVRKKKVRAHRLAFERAHGWLPSVVMHACDNPLCINPDHLFAGTVTQNNKDRAIKGRNADVNGEKNPQAKLTRQDVEQIRSLYSVGNVSYQELAKKFNVHRSTIGSIVRMQRWK